MNGKAVPTEPEVQALRRIEDGVELDLLLPNDLLYLQGHFPGFPILPGVTQIDWAIRYADEHLGTAIGAGCDIQVKFRSVIQPGGLITLGLRLSGTRRRLDFDYRNESGVLSSGSVRLEDG